MQKRENPDQSFMGMDRVIGGPAAKQQALLIHSERSAAKSLGLLASQAASRVDEHETSGAGEPEELTQHRESPRAVVGLKVKECLDVTDIDRGPILFSLFVVQKQREITQRRQRDVDGSVAARQRSRSESPCLGGQQRFGERRHRRLQRRRDGVDAALAPPSGELLGVASGPRHVVGGGDKVPVSRMLSGAQRIPALTSSMAAMIPGVSQPEIQRQVRQQRADIDALYELVERVDQKVDAVDVKLDRRFDEISGQLSEVLRQLGGR